MNIGIIGAGFTGLSAAYYLQKKGHKVTIIEKEKRPGGLAIGYKEKDWDWTLEEHYHHWFTNDKSVLNLAKEIGYPVVIKRPKTSSFVEKAIYQLDSPLSLLKFPRLSIIDRVRTGISIAFLRFNPYWKILENFTAEPYLKKTMGDRAYKTIWEPLMINKLGKYSGTVSLAWFWARVYKRTPRLAYPEKGFLRFAENIENIILEKGGEFIYSAHVNNIKKSKLIQVKYTKGEKKRELSFDKLIVTLPTPIFTKLTNQLPKWYIEKYSNLKGIGAVNIVMRLKKPFLRDNSYWLNMCDKNSPILAVVEHTNFMDTKNYNNEHIVYIGNYLSTTDPRFTKSKEELMKLYDPWLRIINKDYKKWLISISVFKAPFAQPIIPVKYSAKIPPLKTPIKNIYLANIQQVYPWDRGTNYAVELGIKSSTEIFN